jgi:uncharacterized membrane protein YcaP (DUF421 family)
MDIVIRAAFVFIFVWLVLRALGKRQLGELTAFELVLLFVIGDLVQQSITQNDTSITAAVLAISTIALLILSQSYLVFRFRRTRPIVEGTPVMVVHDGRMLHDVMHRERMAPDDVMESARQQGIADLSEVRFGILERDGKLAVVKKDSSGEQQSGGGGHMISA